MRHRNRCISPVSLTVQTDSLDVKSMIDAYVKDGTLPPVGQGVEGSYDFEGNVDGSRPDFDIDSVDVPEFVDKIDEHIFMKSRREQVLQDIKDKESVFSDDLSPDSEPEPAPVDPPEPPALES